MIRPIQGSERRKFPVEIEAMHRLRAVVFHERMAWPPDEPLAGQINPITGELLAGIVEVGIRAGLELLVTVMDVAVEPVSRRAGCPCDRIGSPRRIDKSLAVAGLFEMGTRC